jgi:iron complex transport system permease protein
MGDAAAVAAVPGGARPLRGRRLRAVVLASGLAVILVAVGLVSIAFGSVDIPLDRTVAIIGHRISGGRWFEQSIWTAGEEYIVWHLRTPRVLLALLVGAGLAVAGGVLQSVFRNPLADPYVLGISSGASVGASAVLVLGFAILGDATIFVAAFCGALVSFALVLLISRLLGSMSPQTMLLAGIAVTFAMSAVTSFLMYVAANEGEEGIAISVLFWMLGGLGAARWDSVGWVFLVLVPVLPIVLLSGRTLTLTLIGDEAATALGVNLRRFRLQMVVLVSLLTGVLVAFSGGIGFVGLVVPHAVRSVTGSNARILLPISALAGAAFLVSADLVARTVFAPADMPIGIITALVGSPVFVLLLWLNGRRRYRSQ